MKDPTFPEEDRIQIRESQDTYRYTRENLLIAFAAGVFVGLGFAVSRKLRDIASIVSVGARLYSDISHRGSRRSF